jgi:hypothetical protein
VDLMNNRHHGLDGFGEQLLVGIKASKANLLGSELVILPYLNFHTDCTDGQLY